MLAAANRLLVGLGVAAITLYRYTLSSVMGRNCRHLPTCSEYGIMALRRHGFWRGGWLLLARLVRCRPGGSHGYDPVPENLEPQGLRPWRYARWRGGDTTGDGDHRCDCPGHEPLGKIGRQG
jgi:putative membrane protein insertion efficiency factor